MEPFVLRFLATKGFISGAIKIVEGVSYIDHVEALNRTRDGWIGAHSGIGVQNLPLDWAKNVVWEHQYTLMMTPSQYKLTMDSLESKIGTKYDYAGDVGILLHDRDLDSEHRVQCAGLQYQVLCDGGWQMLNVLKQFAHLVTPETLHLSNKLIGKCTFPVTA